MNIVRSGYILTQDTFLPYQKLMARLVMKFGGTSVADVDRIKHVADLVAAEHKAGHQIAVVLSAMSGTTNRLVDFCKEASPSYSLAEYDAVVASGEQITIGLLAIVLNDRGIKARSWLGWQLPIHTDGNHSQAQIERIATDKIEQDLQQGHVAVVAGFQGLGPDGRISTLGRGGSDTSAVALAAALKADRCDIYTDVDGVYTTDPRIAPKARKLDKISFEEMLELASLGAKVLQTRSVSLAMRENVRLAVRSSFDNRPGTLVCNEEDIMEKNVVSGIAFSRNEARLTLNAIPDKPGVAAAIFDALADKAVNVDMIVQSRTADSGQPSTDMTFTTTREAFDRAVKAIEERQGAIGYKELLTDDNVAKVSIVGVGMHSAVGVAQTMFTALAEKGINIQVIATSEIKISVLIAEEYLELAVRHLHSVFGLDSD